MIEIAENVKSSWSFVLQKRKLDQQSQPAKGVEWPQMKLAQQLYEYPLRRFAEFRIGYQGMMSNRNTT